MEEGREVKEREREGDKGSEKEIRREEGGRADDGE